MPDYQQQNIAGSKWKRAVRIVLENPLNGIPSAIFVEEEVINLDDTDPPITRLSGNVSASFTDLSVEIPLRDPTTWELTGETITMGKLYVGIASAYWQKALERDEVAAAAVAAAAQVQQTAL